MPSEHQKDEAIKKIMQGGNPAGDIVSVSASSFDDKAPLFPHDAEPGEKFEAENGKTYVKNEAGAWVGEGRLGIKGVPMFCPECEGIMKHRNDTTMYFKHGKCFDCVLQMEHELRCNGGWELYEKKKVLANMRDWIRDNRAELEVFRRNKDAQTDVLESGEVLEWQGGNADEVIQEYEEFLDMLDDRADALEERVRELEKASDNTN
jgi:hypothetical protein